MKTKKSPNDSRLAALILAAALSLSPALRADTSSSGAEPKDQTLFMGLNVLVQVGHDYYRVLDIAHDAAVIRVDGQLKSVPFSKINGYRLKKEPKIGTLAASLTNLAGDRAYTPGNDPHRIWGHREDQLAGYADDQVTSLSGQISDDANRAVGKAFSGQGPNAQQIFNAGPALGAVADVQKLSQGMAAQPGDMGNSAFYNERMEEDLDKKLFDAMQVDFEVASNTTLEDPYVIMVTEFRENEQAKETSRWIYIKPLQSIDSHPTKVHILVGGFPPGFALGKYEVHLFNAGREIPTSISEDRMAISRSEAYLYTGFQYLSEHKGQTLPPAPIAESAPVHLRDECSAAELGRTYEIKVGQQGEVAAITPANSDAVDPGVQAIWLKLRFYPALENGKPAPGTLQAKLSDFLR